MSNPGPQSKTSEVSLSVSRPQRLQKDFRSLAMYSLLAIIVLASSQACIASRASTAVEPQPVQKTAQPPQEQTALPQTQTLLIPPLAAATPIVKWAETITPSPPPSVVTITAVDGNLFIRRGPHLAFNSISVLYEGESVTALGRDMLGRWVQIPIPSQPDKTGWISIQTSFSHVSGDVLDLPVIDTVDWAVAAYLRNCTHHQMLVQPGEIVIPPSYDFPYNEMRIYPGIYTVYDLDVLGEPEVMDNVELKEGLLIEIREDASGERRKCP